MKINHLELLYFVFDISVVFIKSLFQSFLTLKKNATLRNLTLGKHFMKLFFRKINKLYINFSKKKFYAFNTIMKLFFTSLQSI